MRDDSIALSKLTHPSIKNRFPRSRRCSRDTTLGTMMTTHSLATAFSDWKNVLGSQYVLADSAELAPYRQNVSGLDRDIPAVLLPATAGDVSAIVRIANTHVIPLHPVSGGRNWGLGSRLPVTTGTVVVDLRRMNRIRDVCIRHHYAVVEPGVTQGQLHRYLGERNLPLLLNVTGSGLDASIIGNALERGIGYFSSRADCLSSLEIVLGAGSMLRTGSGHFPAADTPYLYRHGIGPSIDGLFAQSNYGIVTAAAVDLIPKPEAQCAMLCRVDNDSSLAALIDSLAILVKGGVIRSVVHIGNWERSEITLGPLVHRFLAKHNGAGPETTKNEIRKILATGGFGAWSAVAGLMGSSAQMRVMRGEIRRAIRGVAALRFVTDRSLAVAAGICRKLAFVPGMKRRLALLHAIQPLYGLTKGIPTDAALESVYWPVEGLPDTEVTNPDQSRSGLLYCVPFLPLDGNSVLVAVAMIRDICDSHNFAPYVTFNVVDSKALEAVISLAFDRREGGRSSAAHACIDALTEAFIQAGFPPYRVGIQSMARIVKEDDTFWQTVKGLKAVLDPNNIISPGRYNLV